MIIVIMHQAAIDTSQYPFCVSRYLASSRETHSDRSVQLRICDTESFELVLFDKDWTGEITIKQGIKVLTVQFRRLAVARSFALFGILVLMVELCRAWERKGAIAQSMSFKLLYSGATEKHYVFFIESSEHECLEDMLIVM